MENDRVLSRTWEDAFLEHEQLRESVESALWKAGQLKHVIAMSSCTSALVTAALVSCGPGDEVILPAFGWPGTLFPIVLAGATPVFADIDSNTFTVSTASINSLISPRTRAIVVCAMFGYPPDVRSISELCRKRGIDLIVDLAQGHESTVGGKQLGYYADWTCFSFGQGIGKTIRIGGGGALACRSRRRYELAVSISQHPLSAFRCCDVQTIRERSDGCCFNFRMNHSDATNLMVALNESTAADRFRSRKRKFLRACSLLISQGLESSIPMTPGYGAPSYTTLPLLPSRMFSDNHLDRIDAIATEVGAVITYAKYPIFRSLPTIMHHNLFPSLRRSLNIESHPSHELGFNPNAEQLNGEEIVLFDFHN